MTAPVHKGIINDAGIAFTGHTELLADLDDGANPVMMLCTPGLKVALATTHLPLRAVPDAIDSTMLLDVVHVVARDLRARFSIPAPRIVVCGLNPHAGEGGHLGREEIDSIAPAVEALRAQGIDVRGPVPADTAFTRERLAEADVVVAMYHDQGLPVLKHAGFEAGRQRHPRAQLRAHVGRSRDRSRPRGYGPGRAFEPGIRPDACPRTRPGAPWRNDRAPRPEP